MHKPTHLVCIMFLILFVLPITQSVDEENIAKVICSLSQFSEVDILKETFGNTIKICKYLQKECNIKVRFVASNAANIGRKDIVLFASYEMEKKKEALWSLEKKMLYITCVIGKSKLLNFCGLAASWATRFHSFASQECHNTQWSIAESGQRKMSQLSLLNTKFFPLPKDQYEPWWHFLIKKTQKKTLYAKEKRS